MVRGAQHVRFRSSRLQDSHDVFFLGNAAGAQRHARDVLSRDPRISRSATQVPVPHYKSESDLAHHRDRILKAGLPA